MNSRRILLSNKARTATTTSALQARNTEHRYARLYLDVGTAVAGTGGLTLALRGYSWNGVTTANGEAMGLPGVILQSAAAVTGTGVVIYELGPYPQAASGAVILTVARVLPEYWDVTVVAGDTSSYTYSVSIELHK